MEEVSSSPAEAEMQRSKGGRTVVRVEMVYGDFKEEDEMRCSQDKYHVYFINKI